MCGLRWSECSTLGCEMGHKPTLPLTPASTMGNAQQIRAALRLILSVSSLHVNYEGFKGHLFCLL